MDELAYNSNRQFEELKELFNIKLTGLPGKEKESPTVSESTLFPVVFNTRTPDSIKLSVHFDEDYSQREKEEPFPQSKKNGPSI